MGSSDDSIVSDWFDLLTGPLWCKRFISSLGNIISAYEGTRELQEQPVIYNNFFLGLYLAIFWFCVSANHLSIFSFQAQDVASNCPYLIVPRFVAQPQLKQNFVVIWFANCPHLQLCWSRFPCQPFRFPSAIAIVFLSANISLSIILMAENPW